MSEIHDKIFNENLSCWLPSSDNLPELNPQTVLVPSFKILDKIEAQRQEEALRAINTNAQVMNSRALAGCCTDCGRKYGDEYGFPDLIIPDDVWLKISPTGHSGGLLCPSCICRRLHNLGITTTGKFTSGPLCQP